MALQTVRAANLDKRKRIGNEGRRGAARLGKVAREARRREAAEGVEEAAEGSGKARRAAEGSGQRSPPRRARRLGLRAPQRTRMRPTTRRRPQPSPGPALIQAAFPSPFRQPHEVRPRAAATPVPFVPLGFRSQSQTLGRQHA